MSVVYNYSPTHSPGDSYFSPSEPTSYDTMDSSQTPYFTAPLSPMLNTEFFQAVQARNSGTPPFITSGDMDSSSFHAQANARSIRDTPMNLHMGPKTYSNRRDDAMNKPVPNGHFTSPDHLNTLLSSNKLLLLDARSFVQYSHAHIRNAVGVSVPTTILRRPTFTLEKLAEAIVNDESKKKLQNWQQAEHIILYDQNSHSLQDASASSILHLYTKFQKQGYKGQLSCLDGGIDAFSKAYPNACVIGQYSTQSRVTTASLPLNAERPFQLNLPNASNGQDPNQRSGPRKMHLSLPPMTAPAPKFENQAFNPFFSNIRQNMELSHGGIKERFPVRLPSGYDINVQSGQVQGAVRPLKPCFGTKNGTVVPSWLTNVLLPDNVGPTYIAETYEKIERTEQMRLQNIMQHHSNRASGNLKEHPWSIVSGIEMGSLNRYNNIWPFEYTRVKLVNYKPESTDYINASYIQYIDVSPAVLPIQDGSDSNDGIPRLDSLKSQNESSMSTRTYRRYISTQGPLPATFRDFYTAVWEQNSLVIVMLTKEEEMNRIKCHRYWPSELNKPEYHGDMAVTMVSEQVEPVVDRNGQANTNPDEVIVIRKLILEKKGSNQQRTLSHIQYKGWMDFGVPDDPLGTLRLIELAGNTQTSYEQHAIQNNQPPVGPMFVHCSAGCGRTGAFCTIDTLMTRMTIQDECMTEEEREGQLDILRETVEKFREQRVSMVQTLRQLAFCYEATLWWTLGF